MSKKNSVFREGTIFMFLYYALYACTCIYVFAVVRYH